MCVCHADRGARSCGRSAASSQEATKQWRRRTGLLVTRKSYCACVRDGVGVEVKYGGGDVGDVRGNWDDKDDQR